MNAKLSYALYQAKQISSKTQDLRGVLEELRSYYRYQNDFCDSSTEAIMSSIGNVEDIHHIIDCLEELMDYERDLENE